MYQATLTPVAPEGGFGRQYQDNEKEVSLPDAAGRETPAYVSVGFVAQRCGVSNTTVLRWISSGRLPAFRLPGGHYRVDKHAFSGFLTRLKIASETEPL
jgi:excisionase family DNA binding protein